MELIECKICGLPFYEISWSHLKYRHGITVLQYQESFPGEDIVSLGLGLSRGSSISSERVTNPRKLSSGHLQALSEGHSRFFSEDSPEYWKYIGWSSENQGRYKRTEEYRTKRSEITREVFTRPDVVEKHRLAISAANLGQVRTDEQRANYARAAARIGHSRLGVPRSINGPELIVLILMEKYFSGLWLYNGCSYYSPNHVPLVVGRKIPDFIRADNRKLLVEVFGNYWHSLDADDTRSEEGTRSYYSSLGYNCLVLWEDQVYDKDFVIDSISNLDKVRDDEVRPLEAKGD